ncbi:MAG: hypothetical protein QNJ47_15670 [Nostocaceae cyanobacterium]|nr:hypothetical protein [Nostocaceae cyanobacterium]
MSNLRAWLQEKSPEEREHFLEEIPRLWLEGGQLKKLYSLLSNYDFIDAKINHPLFDVKTLIEDYELIENSELSNYREYNAETLKYLQLIKEALILSAHVLSLDKQQLPGQLTGRLLPFKKQTTIQKLLQQISQTEITWLTPLTPSLTPPNEALINILNGHNGSIWSVDVTPDGNKVISGSQDGTIKIWDIKSGYLRCTIPAHNDSVNTVAISHDGLYIFSGSHDKTIKVWDLKTGKLVNTLTGHYSAVNAITLTHDGSKIISASSDTSIKVWNVENYEVLHTFLGHTASVQAITTISQNNQHFVISGSYNNILKVWNLKTGKEELTLNESDIIWSILAIPDKKLLICGLQDGTFTIWNFETWKKEYIFQGHSNSVRDICVTSDGKRIISVSEDKTLKIWKVGTWENEAIINAHTGSILTVTVTSDGKNIISGSGSTIISFLSNDYSIKVWNLERCIYKLSFATEYYTKTGHKDSVEVVAFTPDEEYLISAAKDGNFIFWKMGTWINEASFTGKSQSALSLGDYVNYKVFQLQASDVECTFHSIINTLPFLIATTSDGMLQIWSSGDETIKVWDAWAKKFIASFTGESSIKCCAIAPDGLTIVAGEKSGNVHFLRLQGIEVQS